jgi:hypothetical protein
VGKSTGVTILTFRNILIVELTELGFIGGFMIVQFNMVVGKSALIIVRAFIFIFDEIAELGCIF